MKRKQVFNDLRKRAENLLKRCRLPKRIPNKDISNLVEELTLYQIELEIQNEDLIKAQIELEASQIKYIELYDLAPIGYFSIGKDGLIKEVNQAGCSLFGLKKEALINRSFSRYIAADYQAIFAQYRMRAFKDLSQYSFELKLLKWSQSSFYALVECKAVENQSTGYRQLLTFVSDISARKLAETSLHQYRTKMASIDRARSLNEMMHSMVQDQNSSLTIINNYLYGCIKRLETDNCKADDVLPVLKKIANQSRYLTDLILNRRSFTTKYNLHFEYMHIHTIISHTISLLTHELLEFPVIIQYEQNKNISLVKLDKFHIQQAIINLARNAIEAMRDGNIKEPKLLIETVQTEQNMVEVTLFDNGPGINEELISKLFMPHFTTKAYSIGLGLTVSRAIIEKHGGQLFALASPSGGACFRFTLPCSMSSPAAERSFSA